MRLEVALLVSALVIAGCTGSPQESISSPIESAEPSSTALPDGSGSGAEPIGAIEVHRFNVTLLASAGAAGQTFLTEIATLPELPRGATAGLIEMQSMLTVPSDQQKLGMRIRSEGGAEVAVLEQSNPQEILRVEVVGSSWDDPMQIGLFASSTGSFLVNATAQLYVSFFIQRQVDPDYSAVPP